jgi:toxin HigB-1
MHVIKSFGSAATERLFNRERVKQFQAFERQALRKLAMIHAAKKLEDLAALPGNRLEKLRGNRKHQHSIRINDQWRICFVWKESDAYEVEITDYHD